MSTRIDSTRFYDLSLPGEVRVSPSGDRAAVVVHEFDQEEQRRVRSLYLVSTAGGRTRRISRVGSVSTPRWRPDGGAVAVTAARDPTLPRQRSGEGTDEPVEQVWSFDLSGGDPRQLTAIETGVESFDWGPEGRRLVIAAHDPDDEETAEEYPRETDRLQYKSMGGWRDARPLRLNVVNTATEERRPLVDTEAAGALAPSAGLAPRWNPVGEEIAFMTNRTQEPDRSRRLDVFMVPASGGDPERVSTGEVLASTTHWSPDGRRLAYRVERPENPYYPTTLRMYDGEETRTLLNESDGPVRDATWVDDGRVAVLVGDHGETVPAIVDAASGVTSRLEHGSLQAHFGQMHAAGGTVVACLSGVGTPPEVFRIGAESERLTEIGDEFLDGAVPQPVARRLAVERNGSAVDVQVALPPEYDPADGDPLPTVTELHGGPTTYDEQTFDFRRLFWTTRGYAFVRVNYRGSTSFGQEFAEGGRGTWNGPEVRDVLAAVDAVEDHDWADPDRQFLTGYSHGGIVTGYLLTQTDRFAAAAPERGIYDFRAAYGSGDMHSWYRAELGTPWKNPETYDRISSITDVDEIDTPTLVMAGAFDERCPPAQAEQLYVSLQSRSIPTRLVVYDEAHVVRTPENIVYRLETLADWFREHDPGR